MSGTAIYLTGNDKLVPVSLLHNLKHNKVLHERTIFLTFVTRDFLTCATTSVVLA